MLKISEKEIINRIKRREIFSATINNNAFKIKIEQYIPAIFTAIHTGHNLKEQFEKKILLDSDDRKYEEDPYTGDMLESFPIVLQGLDSRYQYDLNRKTEECIYSEAWGKKIWNIPLTQKETQLNKALHQSYYNVLDALMSVIEELYPRCIIYDIHSYNYKRIEADTPLFNIGSYFIDHNLFMPVLKNLEKRLKQLEFPNVTNRVAFDEIFMGRGYQALFIKKNHPKSLCIPLEIKKVYMDENTGEPFPLILEAVKGGIKQALSYNAAYFHRKFCNKKVSRTAFFAEENNKMIKKVDLALFKIAKSIDTLSYINPVNLQHEKRRFFAMKCNYTPQFYYRQLKIDPFEFRENLYSIPVDNIKDVSIRQLYRSTIDILAQKIDLLTTIGTENFLYNSLRFYGEPRKSDIELARFFIATPPLESEDPERVLDSSDCAQAFEKAIKEYGFKCNVELTNRIVARAMVNNAKKTVLINNDSLFSPTEVQALIHHELGIHMVTTLNANLQKLKIFKIGLPGNTETQEGLAILSEHLSGNLNLTRMKILAYRVMAVYRMIQNYDFSRTFKTLNDDYGMSKEAAFNLTARVFRGGGFTKDYLYLTGLRKILALYRSNTDIQILFAGKTSIIFLKTLKEMLARNVISKPVYLPKSWKMGVPKNKILEYLLNALS